MIVVSDTTPLNYLVLIRTVDILPKMFDGVYTSPKVLRELENHGAPEVVRAWAQRPPTWLKIMTPSARLSSTASLDPGEAEAISLAKEIKAPAILLDERKGRGVAVGEGLIVIRTLALLEVAAERRLIELSSTLSQLRTTSFRIKQELIDAALARDVKAQQIPPVPPKQS